jgi:hypothetical protein
VTWVLVAVGGSAVLGAGASYLGSKKQSDASKAAGNLNMEMFNTLNQQQQPYMQSGYGAMGRLNTLLGLNPNPNYRPPVAPSGGGYMPTASGGVHPIMQVGPAGASQGAMPVNNQMTRMKDLLALRAANGDRQAQAMLQRMV